MQYIAETREFQIKEKTVVSIGKFDGLHRGHQKLMHEMLKWKEQALRSPCSPSRRLREPGKGKDADHDHDEPGA